MEVDAMSFFIPSMKRSKPEGWEDQLWADRNGPTDPNGLCIPQRKVNEISQLMRGSSIYKSDSNLKVLLLTGITGTGKSTMVRLLAKSMNLQVIEWEAEQRVKYDPDYVSTMDRFETFMHDTVLRPTLNHNNRNKMILLDDLPDLTSDEIMAKFQKILARYVTSPHPFLMVIVVSDTTPDTVLSTYKSTETRMTHAIDLIPEFLNNTTYVKKIVVNPVTVITMRKKLREIANKEKSSVTERDINDLVEMSEGDLRIAINHMQFYFPPGRRGSHRSLSDDFKKDSKSLSLFHALGKVLYAKRNEDNTLESKDIDIVKELPCTASHFIAHIEANLPNFRSLDDLEKSLEYIAAADTMRPSEYAEDQYIRENRAFISIGGPMVSRKEPLPYNPPRPFRNLNRPIPPHISRSVKLEDIALTLSRVPSTEEGPENWDRVSDFTSDEEMAFDEIFGDGLELADFDF